MPKSPLTQLMQQAASTISRNEISVKASKIRNKEGDFGNPLHYSKDN